MLRRKRREKILQKLDDQSSVRVSDLVEEFDVSGTTIRRDLEKLESEGLIIRDYGGAVKVEQGSTKYEPPYNVKKDENVEEKAQIGRKASSFVKNGESILLDSGSTTLEVAKALSPELAITVVTNDLKVALEITNKPNMELIVLGGRRRKEVYTLQGGIAERNVKDFQFDWTFLGVAGIDDEKLSTADSEEAFLKQQMIDAGQTVAVVADHSKYAQRAFATVSRIERCDLIISDSQPPRKIKEKCQENDVEIVTP